MRKGQIETSRIFTALLLITRTGTTDPIDLGEIQAHKRTMGVGRTEIMRSQPGYRKRVANLIGDRKTEYEITLEEDFPETLLLALLGAQGDDTTQDAGNNTTVNVESVAQGKTYELGKYKLSDVSVAVGATQMDEGTDYEINLVTGTIYIMPDGGIADGDTVAVTFDCAEVEFHNLTSDAELYTAGTIKLFELDQHDDAPAKITSFVGQYYIDADSDHDGKKIASRKLIIIPQTPEIVKMRK